MTNYERIKAMTIEEMAEDLPCPHTGYLCVGEYGFDGAKTCYECTLAWLKEEVQERVRRRNCCGRESSTRGAWGVAAE